MFQVARARSGVATALAGVAIVVACDSTGSPGESDGPAIVERDSAGVTIVENRAIEPAGVATWSVDTTPSLGIGVEMGDPAYEFTRIGGVLRLPNGMIVVLNGQGEAAFEFRFYDSTGKHIVTHGRRGQGPGEYRWINFFGSVGGDTVIGVDFPARRLNWVSASAGHLRSAQLDENRFRKLLGADASGTIETMVPIGDSLYAVKAFRRMPGANRPMERGTSYHIVDLAADTVIDVVRYDPVPVKFLELSIGRMVVEPVDAPDPAHVVDRGRRRICAAITTVTEISCVDRDGKRLTIRWRAESLPYTDEDRESFEETMRNARRGPRGPTPADIEAILGAMERPERHNPFNVLQMDTEGNFWILEPTLDASGRRHSRFRILDPQGRHIAFADPFPARNVGLGGTVHIGASSVLRVLGDTDAVPTVGVFRIRKPS